MSRRASWLIAFCLLLATGRPASAHFIWIEVPQGSAEQAHVYFAEQPEPGEVRLLDKIAKTKAWLRSADGKATDLELGRASDPELGALVAALSPTAAAPTAAASLEATCDYGVYERGPVGVLLQYYAKALTGDWSAGGDKSAGGGSPLARAEKLKLDIVPDPTPGKLTAQVLYDGKPSAGDAVVVIDPAGKEHDLKSDADGRITLDAAAPGNYAVRAGHIEADKSGERDGKRFGQTWHYSTLTLALPSASTAADAQPLSALQTLERSRAARSMWSDDFSGFTSDITVTSAGGKWTGKVGVDANGVVTVDLGDSPEKQWVQTQLDSMVQHRMPDGEVSQGDVRFGDEDLSHPLGRKIDLGDPKLESVYRIKDNVIREVNRRAGPQRFTISVQEVEWNPEGKYLPRSFTMNFFNAESGALLMSHAYWNSWQRVGGEDMPQTILQLDSRGGGTAAHQLELTNLKLAEKKK